MTPSGKLLHFLAGDRRFAVPVAAIAEIREAPPITTVPGAPEAIAGVIDLRGRIVTLLDLAAIFALPDGRASSRLAVQYAEPLAHLALLIPVPVQDLQTSELSPVPEEDAADLGLAGGGPGVAPDDREGRREDALGREVVLAGGQAALLLDLEELARHATRRLRDRFRVGA